MLAITFLIIHDQNLANLSRQPPFMLSIIAVLMSRILKREWISDVIGRQECQSISVNP